MTAWLAFPLVPLLYANSALAGGMLSGSVENLGAPVQGFPVIVEDAQKEQAVGVTDQHGRFNVPTTGSGEYNIILPNGPVVLEGATEGDVGVIDVSPFGW